MLYVLLKAIKHEIYGLIEKLKGVFPFRYRVVQFIRLIFFV